MSRYPDLERLGISTYPGCRIAAFHEVKELYGLTIDELLGKFSDDEVLDAIEISLRLMGVYDMLEEEVQL